MYYRSFIFNMTIHKKTRAIQVSGPLSSSFIFITKYKRDAWQLVWPTYLDAEHTAQRSTTIFSFDLLNLSAHVYSSPCWLALILFVYVHTAE